MVPDTRGWTAVTTLSDLSQERSTQPSALPNLIHFVWVGSPPPAVVCSRLDSWAALNPDAHVLLWSEAALLELMEMPAAARRRGLYDASKNPAAKSDVARFLLLQSFGGMYFDTDMEACRPVTELRWKEHGFIARESRWLLVASALGLPADSLFGELALECMTRCTDGGELDNFMSGPPLITELNRAFVSNGVAGPAVTDPSAFFPDNPFRFPRSALGTTVPYAVHLFDHSWAEGGELSRMRKMLRVAQVATPRDVAVGLDARFSWSSAQWPTSWCANG